MKNIFIKRKINGICIYCFLIFSFYFLHLKMTINEVVDNLFIGSYYDAIDILSLKVLGIKHIINLSQIPFSDKLYFDVYEINIPDSEDINISKYFHKCNNFIVNALIKKEKILCYCFAGMSRSATIILAFLIKKRRMTFEDAYSFLLQKRSIISPNEGFIKQLKKYHMYLF